MKLKTALLSTLLLTSALLASETTPKEEGINAIKMLGGALKSQLQAQMQHDKTGLSAMAFCATQAMSITAEVNEKLPKNVSVRRMALKTRNEANRADALDQKIFAEYEASIEAKTFSDSDIKVVTEGNTTRVYKALVTQTACLKCHGGEISPQIQAEITKNYPDDKAVAFKEGSLRGMIVAEVKE